MIGAASVCQSKNLAGMVLHFSDLLCLLLLKEKNLLI